MKKWVAIAVVLIMVFSLCACGDSQEKNDEVFLKNMTKALEERWKKNEVGQGNMSTKEYYAQLIKAEKDKLGSFSDYTFVDERLESLAKTYFEALDKQAEGAKAVESNTDLYNKFFVTEGYNKRAAMVKLLHDEYGLSVNKGYSSTFEDMCGLGEKVIGIERLTEQPLVLENTGDECVVVVENTASLDLKGIYVRLKLLDANEVVVDTPSGFIEDFSAGSKNRCEIYTGQKSFDHVELCFEQSASGILTEYVPVEYVNPMVIDLEIPNLPVELSSGYSGLVKNSFIVNGVDLQIMYWNNGEANVKLLVSGTKTYDADGENATNAGSITYKLYDENGVMMSSGEIYISNLRINESFNGAEGYVTNGLKPGTYNLILEDNIY